MPGLRLSRDALARLGAAVGSGLLLALAYPPFDLGPLALVALVPLLWSWRQSGSVSHSSMRRGSVFHGPARAAASGFVAGLVFFGITLSWTSNVGVVAMVSLVVAEAAYWAVAGAAVSGLDRLGARGPWLTAAVWVLVEAVRGSWPLGGMPWATVGVAFHDVDGARALASAGGVLLVSFAAVSVNGLLLDVALGVRRHARDAGAPSNGPRRSIAAALVGVVAVLACTEIAVWARFEPRSTAKLRYALVQGNDQDRRLSPNEIDRGYLTERHLALAATLRGRYDLIVFPESAFQTDPEADPALRARLVDLAKEHDSAVLVNAISTDDRGRERNTNRLYSPTGRLVGSYAKQHLVPFGEYVPGRDALSFIGELRQVPHDFRPGRRTVLLDVGGHPVGTVICFEAAFSPLVRSFVRRGAQLLVVSTNNRSYRRSALSAQHVAESQMRAAETGRSVLHAAVSGITAVIDSSGRVRRTNGLFHNAVLSGTVTAARGETPYVRFGEWVLWGSGVVVLASVASGLARRRIAARARPGSPARTVDLARVGDGAPEPQLEEQQ